MATPTPADICNEGLGAIGHTNFIDSLNEGSTEAEVAKLVYDRAIDVVLERVKWKFATRRATLAVLADAFVDPDAPMVRDGWRFTYAIPGDCIAPRDITVPGIRAPSPEQRIPFEFESDDSGGRGSVTGRVLLTDQVDAELQYTARVSNSALWSPLFAEALVWFLASKFALAIQKKPATAVSMLQNFERVLGQAAASQLRQSKEDRPPDSEFITVRG